MKHDEDTWSPDMEAGRQAALRGLESLRVRLNECDSRGYCAMDDVRWLLGITTNVAVGVCGTPWDAAVARHLARILRRVTMRKTNWMNSIIRARDELNTHPDQLTGLGGHSDE